MDKLESDFVITDQSGKSLEHCKDSDFKYYIYYISGYQYSYPEVKYPDNAVSLNKNLIIK